MKQETEQFYTPVSLTRTLYLLLHSILCTPHQSFFIPFNPIASSPPVATLLPLRAEQAMECVEGAVKTTHQAFLDDLCANSAQIGVSVDDSFVDGFLDFSDAGIEEGLFEKAEGELQRGNVKACSDSVFLQQQKQQPMKANTSDSSRAATFSVKDNFRSARGSELSVPADDLADLEWLSHFVEDSPSEYSLAVPGGRFLEKLAGNGPEPETLFSANPCFSIPVQTKARSKRARAGGRVWSLGPPSLTEPSPSSSSSSSSTSSPSPSKAWLIYAGLSQTAKSFIGKPPPAKRPKGKPATEISGCTAQQPRRCSHCLVQKTPQWRAGPHGAKTLCNACGVRYKSGRLFPEYRPACSPTFSSNYHSNNHRKVLELRRKKESDSGLAPPVRSF